MRASRLWLVIALSAFIGSGWLLTDVYPSEMPFPFAGCLHFAVIGLVGLLASLRRGGWTNLVGNWTNLVWAKSGELVAAGLGIFVLPGITSQLVAGAVSSSASVALFCAVPFLMILEMTWFGEGSAGGSIMPSLVGLLGALLLYSVEVPGSVKRTVCLAAVFGCCIVTAAASLWMFKLMRGTRIAAAVMVIGFAGAAVLGVYGVCTGWPRITLHTVWIEIARCMIFDLPVVWATIWMMREVPPLRLAARFLIAPVVTWLEGYATVRGPLEVRTVVALLLIAAGAALVLVKDESEEIPGLRLR